MNRAMITIQHTESEKQGRFEAWLDDTQVGEGLLGQLCELVCIYRL